jgi:hypothetical protein
VGHALDAAELALLEPIFFNRFGQNLQIKRL